MFIQLNRSKINFAKANFERGIILHFTQREQDKLMIVVAAEVARRRKHEALNSIILKLLRLVMNYLKEQEMVKLLLN